MIQGMDIEKRRLRCKLKRCFLGRTVGADIFGRIFRAIKSHYRWQHMWVIIKKSSLNISNLVSNDYPIIIFDRNISLISIVFTYLS